MPSPEDSQKAWQIIQKTVGQDNPQINLANSIAAQLERAREEGLRSAYQQPMIYTESVRRRNGSMFGVFIILALLAGFAFVVLMGAR